MLYVPIVTFVPYVTFVLDISFALPHYPTNTPQPVLVREVW